MTGNVGVALMNMKKGQGPSHPIGNNSGLENKSFSVEERDEGDNNNSNSHKKLFNGDNSGSGSTSSEVHGLLQPHSFISDGEIEIEI